MSYPSSSNSTSAEAASLAEAGRQPGDADQAEVVAPSVLFVDLDGTLHTSDLFAECLIQVCQKSPRKIGNLAVAAVKGRAALKRATAGLSFPDISTLPWRQDLLELLAELRAAGCRIVLATATDATWADRVAAHFEIFDDVIASDGKRNLKGKAKLNAILEYCNENGFDDFAYAGDARADLPIWAEATQAYVVGASPAVRKHVQQTHDNVHEVGVKPDAGRALLKTLRPMQWMKNSLLFVPLVLAHELASIAAMLDVIIAFIALSMCASAMYILNDSLDLQADRRHPHKRHRPLAAGTLSIAHAAVCFVALLVGGFGLAAAALPLGFVGLLLAYVALTVVYATWLKREAMADVVVLAGLYTLRVFAGGVAAGIVVSEWLLTLSVFLFLSLAFAKRHAELARLEIEGNFRARGRGYVVSDLDLIRTLGACCGYRSSLVFALYSHNEHSKQLYANAWALWLICPLALFWISRLWLIAVRGQLNEDPVVFALKDRVSLLLGGVVAALLILAATPLPLGIL
jgi:4-hydroxybenzoate polyprenyltransferase/phosphoserine phosphatase